MEFMSDIERHEHGVLSRDCEAALVVAAMQLLGIAPPEESGVEAA